MKIQIVHNSISNLNTSERERLSKSINYDRNESIEIGDIYKVQAIGNWKDRLNYYIELDSDENYPVPIPAEFCMMINSSTPKNWKVGLRENDNFTKFIFTFPDWAEDPIFYEKLIDEDPDAIASYEKNKL